MPSRCAPRATASRSPGREYAQRVPRITAGLASLGIERGDTVALMLTNRPEFNLADTGALHLGATAFSVYNTSTPEQVEFLFGNAANRVAITERAFLPVVRAAQQRSPDSSTSCSSTATRMARSRSTQLEEMGASSFDFDAAWRAVEPDDVATLIYTSGTTGPPKGVQLTHRNLMAEIRAVATACRRSRAGGSPRSCRARTSPTGGPRTTSPRWCSASRSPASPTRARSCSILPEVRPTVWGAVPASGRR